jgi:hypothetical protein
MPQVPRIRRAEPSGNATQPPQPLPVVASQIWHDGSLKLGAGVRRRLDRHRG